MRGDQIGRPKPGPQRGARPVHHRSGRDRGLQGTGRAFPEVAALKHPGALPAAARADEALRPARRRQVVEARSLSREAVLKLHDRAREVWTSHRRTVEAVPDGTGYASVRYEDSLDTEPKLVARPAGPLNRALLKTLFTDTAAHYGMR